jgi:hypothetical protein
MTTETRKTHRLPWRRGLAAVAVLATSTMASASGQLSYLLQLPENLPVIEFENDGSSHIAYNGSNFSVDAHTTFVTLPNGEQDVIIYIADGVPVPASGVCPSPYFFAYDVTGTAASCLTDNGWGTLAFRSNVVPATAVVNGSTVTDPNTPVVVPGVADACGNGGTDDLCIQGAVLTCLDPAPGTDVHQCNFSNHWQIRYYSPGVPVLTGKRTKVMTSRSHASGDPNLQTSQFGPFDKFETVVQVTGGVLYNAGVYTAANAGSLSDPRRTVLLEGLGFSAYDPTQSFIDWTLPFNEPTRGLASATTAAAFLPPLDKCNGQISGSVTDFNNPSSSAPNAEVQLTGPASATITPAANGAYQTANNLCGGTYTVTVPIPTGYLANGPNVQTVTLTPDANGNDASVTGINFSLYAVLSQNAFMTFSQNAWGSRPKGTNAGQLMTTYFPLAYPSGELVIGVADPTLGFSITMTGPQAVTDLLPQEGRPVVLARSYVDPTSLFKLKHKGKLINHKRIGALAGETLALELNVDFSNLGITKPGLGALHLAGGALKGQTVAQVLALANSVLGRGTPLPSTLKNIDALEDIVEAINRNYEAGTVDRKYLVQ